MESAQLWGYGGGPKPAQPAPSPPCRTPLESPKRSPDRMKCDWDTKVKILLSCRRELHFGGVRSSLTPPNSVPETSARLEKHAFDSPDLHWGPFRIPW